MPGFAARVAAVKTSAAPAIDALVFDVGGVLIDVNFKLAFAHWAQCAQLPVERIATRFKVDAAYAAHERGEIDAAQYFATLRHSLGIDLPDQAFETGWNAIFRGVYPGAAELLAEVAVATPVYLFSNTNALHYDCWRALYPQIITPVTRLFCSQELGLRKPSIASFEKVCALIGAAPQRIAFFDDLAENIDGARRCGLNAFHIASPPALRNAVYTALAAG